MDGAVASGTTASQTTTACAGSTTEHGLTTIGSTWVPRPVMATLAELWLFFFQEFGCLGAMASVAFCAIFLNRRVFPYIGAALVSVAFVAELVYIFCLDHAVA